MAEGGDGIDTDSEYGFANFILILISQYSYKA